ncbi:MAG: DNA alkylation repair protein [Prevotellaceae bacterium]|jgi:3-methyladenine DNA glycosylase AlkD|nr:DNA alkylation repair protein [Prevotellaceae bacterium]
MQSVLAAIRKALKENADAKTAASAQYFFKEKIKTIGVKSAVVHKIAQAHFKIIKGKSKEEIFALCEILWQSGYIEEANIACDWSNALRKHFTPADFNIFERWVTRYVTNWAMCDMLCNHTVGGFIEQYPAYIKELKRWATSDNRWVKRAAAVTLIIPARKGLFLQDIFEIADRLLPDTDDMVQKGYGWMLKAASEAHEKEVFDYVVSKKAVMPRTAYRYAIEKMSPGRKAEAMKK